MYVIITKNEELAAYAKEMECEVFRDYELIIIGKDEKKFDTEVFLTAFLGRLAIDPDIKGYDYLKYVLRKCIKEDGYYRKGVIKVIYPECAKYFSTTVSRVERSMRHAIETSFEEVPELYNKIFCREINEAPAPSKFIAVMAVYIKNILSKEA